MKECPAELVVERGKFGKWLWAVCQPDANWGVYKEGFEYSQKEAERIGWSYLREVHFKQGY